MSDLNFLVIREPVINVVGGESYTPGVMYANGLKFCQVCEDQDRKLEKGGVKVATRTAIPRGKYKITVSFSHNFQKELPEVLSVPQYTGVRIHGGNKAEHSQGCLLVGQVRTSSGIAKCADTVQRIIDMINKTEDSGGQCWLEIK